MARGEREAPPPRHERVQAPHVGVARRHRRASGRTSRRARRGSARSTTPDTPGSTSRSSTAGRVAPRPSSASFQQEAARYEIDTGLFSVGSRDGRPDAPRARHRGAEATAHPGVAARRRGLVPAVQRAGRRLRPRRPHDARRPRRRRVDRRRPEGLEQLRPHRRLGHPAHPHRLGRPEAPRHHLLPRRHDDSRGRGASAAPDHRGRALQRDVPRRACTSRTRTCSAS